MEAMNIGIGFYNIWLICVAVKVFVSSLMMIGDKLRGVKIVNFEDHENTMVRGVSSLPLLAFLVVSIFTPITTGIFLPENMVMSIVSI